MRTGTTNRASVTIAILLITVLAIAAARAHEDSSAIAVPEYTLTLTEVVELDSQFAIINADYLPLKPILEKSCFDCHSDLTDYPWYYRIPGITGIIKDHIRHGRKYLDLSDDFPFATENDILEALEKIKEKIEEDDMPLHSYRLMRWGRLIEGAQRDSLFNWIDQSTNRIKEVYRQHGIPTGPEEEP